MPNVLRTACFGEPRAVWICLLPACVLSISFLGPGVIFKRTQPHLGQSFIKMTYYVMCHNGSWSDFASVLFLPCPLNDVK